MSITDSGYNEPVKQNSSETTVDSVNGERHRYLEKGELVEKEEKSASITCAGDAHPQMVEKTIWQIQSTVGTQPIALSFLENKEIEVWTRILPAAVTNPLNNDKDYGLNVQKNIDNKTYLVLPKRSEINRQCDQSTVDEVFLNRFDSSVDVKYSDWDMVNSLRTRTRTNLNDFAEECHSAKSGTSIEKYKSRERMITPSVKESKSEVRKNDSRKGLNSKNAELDQKFNNSMEKLMKFMKSRKGNVLSEQPKTDAFASEAVPKINNLNSDQLKISKTASNKRPLSASSNNTRTATSRVESRNTPLGLRDYEPVFTKTGLMSTVKKSVTKKLDEPRINFSNNAKRQSYLFSSSKR